MYKMYCYFAMKIIINLENKSIEITFFSVCVVDTYFSKHFLSWEFYIHIKNIAYIMKVNNVNLQRNNLIHKKGYTLQKMQVSTFEFILYRNEEKIQK